MSGPLCYPSDTGSEPSARHVTIQLTQPRSEAHWLRARRLVEEYAASLNLDLSFQNLQHELENLATEYGVPAGAFLVAEEDGIYLGCVGVRHLSPEVGEIKRMYVSPAARGRGSGRLLAEGIVEAAKALGYARLRLDTLPDMKAAQALYSSLGFKPIPPYYFNPVSGTVFMELALS